LTAEGPGLTQFLCLFQGIPFFMNSLKIDSHGVGSSWFLASDRPLFMKDRASSHAANEIQACRAREKGATQDFVMGPRGPVRAPRQARGPLGACKERGAQKDPKKIRRRKRKEGKKSFHGKAPKESKRALVGPGRTPDGVW
jgi:hypothetical protein